MISSLSPRHCQRSGCYLRHGGSASRNVPTRGLGLAHDGRYLSKGGADRNGDHAQHCRRQNSSDSNNIDRYVRKAIIKLRHVFAFLSLSLDCALFYYFHRYLLENRPLTKDLEQQFLSHKNTELVIDFQYFNIIQNYRISYRLSIF